MDGELDNLGYGQRISLQVYKRHAKFPSSTSQEFISMYRKLSTQRIHLPRQVIVKAPGLLPMLYTVRELSEDLGMPERTLRDWLKRRRTPQLG